MSREDLLRQMIEEYKRKIEIYQTMVHEWEAEVGGPGSTVPLASTLNGASAKKKSSSGEPVAMVRDYQFFNKSQPEAAKLFLEMVGHPLKTTDIIAGIEKGGVTVGGKTPSAKKTNFYTILYRSDDFATVGKDTWGLTTWPGVKKDKEKEPEPEEKKVATA